MIASVEGILVRAGEECVVETGGIGLRVLVTAGVAAGLPSPGDTVRFWTHLSVREDGWTLYGFRDPDELALFRLLITVNGVGPKLALNALGGASAATVAAALHAGDEKALCALPGVGKKTAARMILDLGAKVPAALLVDAPVHAGAPVADPEHPHHGAARDMLLAMGLPAARAGQVLAAAAAENADCTEDPARWVRAALRHVG